MLCLTDDNGSKAANAHISQSTCSGDDATLWYLALIGY
jgi:hypothetical protein